MNISVIVCIGGAGFIGSHFVNAILDYYPNIHVVIIDSEISGNFENLKRLEIERFGKRYEYINKDISTLSTNDINLNGATVINFAANPDLSLSFAKPSIDFERGTAIHNHVLELCRQGNAAQLLFTSGSGVYGNNEDKVLDESIGYLSVSSPYGANKLASEALTVAYSNMFGLKAKILRFGNVVGLNQTHGVAYDFINKLLLNPSKLDVLGDGFQSKPYIHISDVISAIILALETDEKILVANASTEDCITVREIAEIVVNEMDLKSVCKISYGDKPYGWPGDIPIVRLNSDKLKKIGWTNKYSSEQAIKLSVKEMVSRFSFK